MRPNSVDKTCENCGALYRVQAYRAERTKFCSIGCLYAGRPKPSRQEVTLMCEGCKQQFVVAAFRKETARFCSKRCGLLVRKPEFEAKRHAAVAAIDRNKQPPEVRAKKKRDIGEKYYAANKPRLRAMAKVYYSENKPLFRARSAKYEADKIRATPSWADLRKIKEFYVEAARLTRETGIPHEVDHIYPLRSKVMCGLHVETNLQVITAEANRKKSNHPPTEERTDLT